MIQVEHRDGLFCPMVLCDECGRKITDHREGNANWTEDGKIIRHVHKACDRRGMLWCDLADHFRYVLRNLGVTCPCRGAGSCSTDACTCD